MSDDPTNHPDEENATAVPDALTARIDQLAEERDIAEAHARFSQYVAGSAYRSECEVERWARNTLAALPLPLDTTRGSALMRKRLLLRRLAAELAARNGRPDELGDLVLLIYREHGGSLLPWVQQLVNYGSSDGAAVWARYALAHKDCRDRAELEALLLSIGEPPSGWVDAVGAFAANPSVSEWEKLMRFTPAESFYQRSRNTLQMLMRMDVDHEVLFRCATHYGILPDAIELVDTGRVAPETVLERGEQGPVHARGLWFGLAARAAFARGNRLGTVRFLREACLVAHPAFPPTLDVAFIRADADRELNDMLDRAGVSR